MTDVGENSNKILYYQWIHEQLFNSPISMYIRKSVTCLYIFEELWFLNVITLVCVKHGRNFEMQKRKTKKYRFKIIIWCVWLVLQRLITFRFSLENESRLSLVIQYMCIQYVFRQSNELHPPPSSKYVSALISISFAHMWNLFTYVATNGVFFIGYYKNLRIYLFSAVARSFLCFSVKWNSHMAPKQDDKIAGGKDRA